MALRAHPNPPSRDARPAELIERYYQQRLDELRERHAREIERLEQQRDQATRTLEEATAHGPRTQSFERLLLQALKEAEAYLGTTRRRDLSNLSSAALQGIFEQIGRSNPHSASAVIAAIPLGAQRALGIELHQRWLQSRERQRRQPFPYKAAL